MPQIIPIKELKNAANVSELCHQTAEPIYVTKNGYGDMVIMSIELYESLNKKWDLYRDIELSEKQYQNGLTKDARISLQNTRSKYGL